MTAHLPALQVVVPLVAALLCALLRRSALAWGLTLAASWATAAMAALLLLRVLAEGTISYHIGSWEPPWGIEYRIDVLNGLVLLLVAAVGAAIAPYARRSVAAEIAEEKQVWFYTMYLLCLTGLLGIVITGDAFNVFVFMEISSLATYVLIALGRDRRALLSAYQYLIMGTIGATFYVIGIGFLYTMTGTLNIADMAARIGEVQSTRTVLAGTAFLTVGICLKLALFPLHVWLPNAYAYAPSVATAFLAATATKVAIYLLIRIYFSIFGAAFAFEALPITEVFVVLSLAAILGASTVAAFQRNVKRMLAYSSVGQIGYITLGIGLASQLGLTGGIVHIVNHALMKGALFLAMGAVAYRIGSVRLDDMAGIGRRMPLTMASFVVAGLSLIGSPGTVGFVSKWYLALAALERGWWWLVAAILLGSVIALVYIGRVVEAAYFRAPAAAAATATEAPLSLLVPTWVLTAACVWFGIDTELTVGIAARAAAFLLGAGP
ncbi:MAG: monovalent cation/H+ antiporter subunit D family protein [Alphaproteobacteria bacterium]|nr:monovalent cation/H+ antiporter subunit D family protein [Alphaproteobacteria bacterium]